MDYLKDLENRRKRELGSALQRLGLDKTPDGVSCGVMSTSPKMSEWVTCQQDKDRKVEAFYTQVYIGLRRWVRDFGVLKLEFSLTFHHRH